MPHRYGPVDGTIRIPTCRHDWRSCTDNRDWAGNADRTEAQGACLSLAEGASRLGHFAWDDPWSGPRFDTYLSGASIRKGRIVLVDRGALARDGFGGWVRTPLHCTFDFVARRALKLAPP